VGALFQRDPSPKRAPTHVPLQNLLGFEITS
jgi:hypothetical protein